jgi:endoglucanase
LKETFLKLVSVGAPSGFEEPMIKVLKTELEPYVDEVYDTPRGNVIGIKKGLSPDSPSVALVAHIDQVGLVVQNIDEKGFIWFKRIGGASTRAILAQQVLLLTDKGPVPGVVGIKPGHVTKPEEAFILPQIEEMYIDVGAFSKEEVDSMGVTIGTPVVFGSKPLELANELISSPAVDDRAGVTILVEVAKSLANVKTPSTIYYVGAVEEEIGLRGAGVALFDLDVDIAIAIDTTPAGFQPDVNMREIIYEVGKGPVIHIGEFGVRGIRVHHHKIRKWLIDCAKTEDLEYQTAFMHGGTDADALAQINEGLPALAVGIPRRYSHSPVELFSLKDMEKLAKILVVALKSLNEGFNLHRV